MSPNSKSDSGQVLRDCMQTLHPSLHSPILRTNGGVTCTGLRCCAEAPTYSDTSCESYAVRGVSVKKEMKTHKVCGALAYNV